MVSVIGADLIQIRTAIVSEIARQRDLPCHVAAFIAWVLKDDAKLRAEVGEVVALSSQSRHPEHVAALGYGAAAGLLSDGELALFDDEISHLRGRKFFIPGRPLRFEIDGAALVGVALGVGIRDDPDGRGWLADLLGQSAKEVSTDEWQSGLVRLAKHCVGELGINVMPPDLAIASAARGLISVGSETLEEGWLLAASLKPHTSGPDRDAARLAAFDFVLARSGQIAVSAMTRESLVQLLQNISRSMRLWTFERERRTPNSPITQWGVENEYHVQNLLWAVLAPVLPDLEDEENLPSIGHKKPRADLGVPSLNTIIEVKFMRRSGQRACAKIIEEIAADASLYLSKSETYDNIICFIWDECRQTEQYDELKAGLTAIKGVSAAVILARPSTMERSAS